MPSFTGYERDAYTGLEYAKNRYYDPAISSDPYPTDASDLLGMNLYNYVQGNPQNSTDPLGWFKVISKVEPYAIIETYPNDTLQNIANYWNIELNELIKINSIPNVDLVMPHTQLKVPVCKSSKCINRVENDLSIKFGTDPDYPLEKVTSEIISGSNDKIVKVTFCIHGGYQGTNFYPGSDIENLCRKLDDNTRINPNSDKDSISILGNFPFQHYLDNPNQWDRFRMYNNHQSEKDKILDYIVNNKVTNVNIIGFSHGGCAALELAKKMLSRGTKVDNLITIDPICSYRIAPVEMKILHAWKVVLDGFIKADCYYALYGCDFYYYAIPANVTRSLNLFSKESNPSMPAKILAGEGIRYIYNAYNIGITANHRNIVTNPMTYTSILSFLHY